MSTWLYNENDSGHRGVWHIVEDLTWKEYPATDKYDERKIVISHKRTCPRYDFGDVPKRARRTYYAHDDTLYDPPDCTCGVGVEHSIGKFQVHQTAPAYRLPEKADAICGQVTIYPRGWLNFPWIWKAPKGTKDGDVIESKPTHMPQPYVFEGDIPPGPYCSRCVKKVSSV